MKKIIISGSIVITIVIYLVFQRLGNKEIGVNNTPSPTPDQTSTESPAITPEPTQIKSSGAYKDGQYTGSVADSIYGNVQVEAIIEGGKLTDVKFLQFPNDRPHSIEVSNQSLPILKQEAIQAQSSKVDVVSGATQTWEAFVITLASALNQAK